MPATAYDEVWEKHPDGSMRQLQRVERLLSDNELADQESVAALARLAVKKSWTASDLQEAVRAIIRRMTYHEE